MRIFGSSYRNKDSATVVVCILFKLFISLTLIISGVGKLLNIKGFTDILLLYGFSETLSQLLAIIIPPTEIILGICIALSIWSYYAVFSSLILLLTFSTAMIYGYLTKDINTCGCFGEINIFNDSLIPSIIKNLCLILMSAFLLKIERDEFAHIKLWQHLVILIVTAAAFGLSGSSSAKPLWTKTERASSEDHQQRLVSEMLQKKISYSNSIISKSVGPLSRDTTYLIIAYNPSCAHCQYMMENVKSYQRTGLVQKIVGVSSEKQEEIEKFSKDFDLNFQTLYIPQSAMEKFSPTVPTAFIVKDDSVISIMRTNILPASAWRKKAGL